MLVKDGHWRAYKGMSLANWFMHLGSGKFTKILQNSDCFTCLQSKDKKVEQCDGVAMSFPLGPTITNVFMRHFENIWLVNSFPHFKPIVYA